MADFGSDSSSDEVLEGADLFNRRVLITGVSSGLGLETARALVSKGASVIGTVRDIEKGAIAKSVICPTGAPGNLELIELDLGSLESVRATADKLRHDGAPFDLIVANAGIMACPQSTTEDGFETQFGTNHLGHFLFVNRLCGLLADGSRLVSLSSAGHHLADVDFGDPNFTTTPYDPFIAYGRSKTANALFAVEFDRRHKAKGIRAVAVHPGGILTDLLRHYSKDVQQELAKHAKSPGSEFKSVSQGAATTIWAGLVADGDSVGGRYCEDCSIAPIVHGADLTRGVEPYALDSHRAMQLWTKSEEMVGEEFSVRMS